MRLTPQTSNRLWKKSRTGANEKSKLSMRSVQRVPRLKRWSQLGWRRSPLSTEPAAIVASNGAPTKLASRREMLSGSLRA